MSWYDAEMFYAFSWIYINIYDNSDWCSARIMLYNFISRTPRYFCVYQSSRVFMLTSSYGNIFRVTGPLCVEFTGHRWISPQKGQWHGASMFSLTCAWTNGPKRDQHGRVDSFTASLHGWVNKSEAGDLRRHRAHYDVTVMYRQVLTIQYEDCIFVS